MSKVLLKLQRNDVRALDELFCAMKGLSWDQCIRVIRFYCGTQSIQAKHVFPEIYNPENR